MTWDLRIYVPRGNSLSKQPSLHNTALESHGAWPVEGCNAHGRGMAEKPFLTTPGKKTNVISLLASWNATQSHLLWDAAWMKDQVGVAASSTSSNNSHSTHWEGF